MNRSIPHRAATLVALLIGAACREDAAPTAAPSPLAPEHALLAKGGSVAPSGTGIGTTSYSQGPRTRYAAEYHGGPLLVGTSRVYYLFYGNWDLSGPGHAETVLANFIVDLSGSAYSRISNLYGDATDARPGPGLVYGRSSHDNYSRGSVLSEPDVDSILVASFRNGALPVDPTGVYMIVPSADVSVGSGLGVSYCAYRGWTYGYQLVRVAYAVIGHPARNPSGCAPQQSGPNGDYAADAMTSLVAAELMNTLVDPFFDAWYDRVGLEPADKCAWDYGPVYQAPNGALANIQLGPRHYLLQKLWVPGKGKTRGYCSMTPPSP